MEKGIIAVDLFCGAGGLTRGLLDAGIAVKKGFDNDPGLKDTYEKNNPGVKFFCRDISEVTKEEVLEGLNTKDNFLLLAGCAPCQPFSRLLRKNKRDDSRVNLLLQFGRLVSEVRPDFVFVENVPGLKNGKGKIIFSQFEDILKKEGYSFISDILDAKDYGVPQKRKRLVLLASRHFEIGIPPATYGLPDKSKLPYVTVRDVIARFPIIRAGGKHKEVPNHECRDLSALNKKRLKHIKKNGGTRLDLPKRLRLKCHKKHNGHTDVYGRMKWDDVSPTLTCKCNSISNGRFGHPTQLRAISVREAAALQTFKDTYFFYGNMSENSKWVGNAVPPLFARCLAEGIKKSIPDGGVEHDR